MHLFINRIMSFLVCDFQLKVFVKYLQFVGSGMIVSLIFCKTRKTWFEKQKGAEFIGIFLKAPKRARLSQARNAYQTISCDVEERIKNLRCKCTQKHTSTGGTQLLTHHNSSITWPNVTPTWPTSTFPESTHQDLSVIFGIRFVNNFFKFWHFLALQVSIE